MNIFGKSKKKVERNFFATKLSISEKMYCFLKGSILIFIISYLYYRSFIALFILMPVNIIVYKLEKNQRIKKRKWQFQIEFRDMLISVATSLQAGYSIENAFLEARNELFQLYGKGSILYQELCKMEKILSMNISLESFLENLADKCEVSDVKEFSEVFMIAKRNGGNMNSLLRYAAEKINDRIQIKEDIQVVISAKQYEFKVMCMIPFAMVFYINWTSPDFFICLYNNITGIMIATACLLIYLAAYIIAQRMIEISL